MECGPRLVCTGIKANPSAMDCSFPYTYAKFAGLFIYPIQLGFTGCDTLVSKCV